MGTFLIIGGTGKVGRRVATHLTHAGHLARVASCTGEDVRFDWRDPATYRSAVDGVDGVFVVGPGSATDWPGSLTEFLEVAAGAGVRHVVLLPARGVEFLPDGAVARAERALADGPIPWTILRPTHFAQNFTVAMFVPVAGAVIAPVGEGTEPFVDVGDIAEVAATVLASDGWKNETIDISGPYALGFADAVAIPGEHAKRLFRYETETPATTWRGSARRIRPRAISSGEWPCSAGFVAVRTRRLAMECSEYWVVPPSRSPNGLPAKRSRWPPQASAPRARSGCASRPPQRRYCRIMKRITYSGGSIVTGNAITAALLTYTTSVADAENSVTVEITVLEENGETSIHTLLLGPASQFDVADVGGISDEEEERRFPVPELPQIGIAGKVEANGDAGRTANDVDKVMTEIDDGMGQVNG